MNPAGGLAQRWLAWVIVAAFLLPLLLGLSGTLAPAFGLAPTLAPGPGFSMILNDPRFLPSLRLSLSTGLIATLLVLGLTLLTLVCFHGTRWWYWLHGALPPILAVPHAAIAIGLIFLLSPSGALVRLVSPALTGWERPPAAWVVPDADGWALIIGLVIKETPFLLLAAIAQLATLDVDASLRIGRTLGYAPARCWSRLILPRLYPRIRLTLLIILAYNLTVVDMAILLGPGSPPTLSVLLLSLVSDPGARAAASAGAVLLAVLVGACFVLLFAVERLIAYAAQQRRQSGARGRGIPILRKLGETAIALLLFTSGASLLVLLVWSFTRRWRFPDPWPGQWTLDNWSSRADLIMQPAWETLHIAVAVTLLAMLTAIAWLELERRMRTPRLTGIWFIPLLVPQVSLLFGWQAVALWAGLDGHWWIVVYTHWLYVLPYVILILSVAWRELDPAWGHAAHALGAGYWRVLWSVRLPLLRRPLCQAAAVAVAVSVAQYLPTLLMGAGRFQTLTTELVTSFGGVDRRIIAVLAVMQSLLPLLAFVASLIYPLWRRSRMLRRSVPQRSVVQVH